MHEKKKKPSQISLISMHTLLTQSEMYGKC